MRKEICVSVTFVGLGLIGVGLFKMYQPIALIYFGLVVVYFANKNSKEKEEK